MFVYSYSSQTSLDKLLDINSKFRQYRSDMHPDPHILLVGVVGMCANKLSLCPYLSVSVSSVSLSLCLSVLSLSLSFSLSPFLPLSLSLCSSQANAHFMCFSLSLQMIFSLRQCLRLRSDVSLVTSITVEYSTQHLLNLQQFITYSLTVRV